MPQTQQGSTSDIISIESVLDTTEICAFSQLLKACGDPLRVQILQVLGNDTFGVLELTRLFDTKQSGMSHHLKVLSAIGLVEAQREGNAVFYRRPFSQQTNHDQYATEQLLKLIDRFPLADKLKSRIADIRDQRAIQSQAFFARNADRIQVQQELISNHSQYASASLNLLCKSNFSNDATIMELGPGEGLFLKDLSQNFSQVIALDNSQDMLDKAKNLAKRQGLTNLSFYQGDTAKFKEHKLQVDAIVMNMVLHHVPTPAQIFSDAFSILKSQGVLVICDLSHHHQEWARENCGDLWLGFEAQELSSWAKRAGFQDSESVIIGLRNGFQIQLRKFIKSDNSNSIHHRKLQ